MSVRQMTRPGRSQKAGQAYLLWLSVVLTSTLLFLSSCASFSSPTQVQIKNTPTAKSKVTPTKPTCSSTPSSVDITPTQSPTNFYDEISLLHNLLGPQGWMWSRSGCLFVHLSLTDPLEVIPMLKNTTATTFQGATKQASLLKLSGTHRWIEYYKRVVKFQAEVRAYKELEIVNTLPLTVFPNDKSGFVMYVPANVIRGAIAVIGL